jgi:two-component system chemotaxis response regulator CheY
VARTVLIVDDVAFARRVIKDILIAARYTVVGEAANGEEAVALFAKHKPDVVTMDVVMPKKGGIEAARQIIDQHKNACIIMVSAMGHEQLLMEAINAGARDYILKPFSAEDLIHAIEKAMNTGEDEREGKDAKGASTHGAV